MLRRPFLVRRLKAAYEQAVALDPTLVDARRGLVMVYSLAPGVMGGSMPKAREQAAEILKLNPLRGHIAYGTIAERGKDYTGAEKEFLAAIAAMPDNAIPYNAAPTPPAAPLVKTLCPRPNPPSVAKALQGGQSLSSSSPIWQR